MINSIHQFIRLRNKILLSNYVAEIIILILSHRVDANSQNYFIITFWINDVIDVPIGKAHLK